MKFEFTSLLTSIKIIHLLTSIKLFNKTFLNYNKASCAHKRVTAYAMGCGFDSHSRK